MTITVGGVVSGLAFWGKEGIALCEGRGQRGGSLTEIEEPIRASGEGVGLLARLDGVDFRWV